MRSADTATALRRVYDPLYTASDYLSVPEVILQSIVVREEQPSTADSGQGKNVFVVGAADALGPECIGLRLHIFIRDSPGATCPLSRPKPSYKSGVPTQLDQKSATDYKRPSSPVQPTE